MARVLHLSLSSPARLAKERKVACGLSSECTTDTTRTTILLLLGNHHLAVRVLDNINLLGEHLVVVAILAACERALPPRAAERWRWPGIFSNQRPAREVQVLDEAKEQSQHFWGDDGGGEVDESEPRMRSSPVDRTDVTLLELFRVVDNGNQLAFVAVQFFGCRTIYDT